MAYDPYSDEDFRNRRVFGTRAAIEAVSSETYTLGYEDNGRVLRFEAECTVLFPATLPEGFNVGLLQWTADPVTFQFNAGASNRSGPTGTSGQYGFVSVMVGANAGGSTAEYLIAGDAA